MLMPFRLFAAIFFRLLTLPDDCRRCFASQLLVFFHAAITCRRCRFSCAYIIYFIICRLFMLFLVFACCRRYYV